MNQSESYFDLIENAQSLDEETLGLIIELEEALMSHECPNCQHVNYIKMDYSSCESCGIGFWRGETK